MLFKSRLNSEESRVGWVEQGETQRLPFHLGVGSNKLNSCGVIGVPLPFDSPLPLPENTPEESSALLATTFASPIEPPTPGEPLGELRDQGQVKCWAPAATRNGKRPNVLMVSLTCSETCSLADDGAILATIFASLLEPSVAGLSEN